MIFVKGHIPANKKNQEKVNRIDKEKLSMIVKSAQERFVTACEILNPKYKTEWFHEHIANILQNALEKIKRGEKVRIILALPPRHGKSETASVLFPAWALGKYPDMQFILSSYGADLSEKMGLKTRDVLNSAGYKLLFPDIEIRKDVKAKAKWMTNKGGSYSGVGIGTSVTGTGADCVIPYCTVRTDHGTLPILKVKPGYKVLGYNHETNKPEWTTVRAVAARISDKRVVNVGGLKATEDHRIYIREKGYIPISEVSDFERVVRLTPSMSHVPEGLCKKDLRCKKDIEEQSTQDILFGDMFKSNTEKGRQNRLQNMFSLQWSKGLSCCNMQKVFSFSTKSKSCEFKMSNMWNRLQSSIFRGFETKGKRTKIKILLKGVLFTTKDRKNGSKKEEHLYWLWHKICKSKEILYHEMLYNISIQKQSNNTIYGTVACNENSGTGKRQSPLSSLWGRFIKVECSSFGQQCFQSRFKKPCDSVHGMPLEYSQDKEICAGDIAKLHGWEDYVVDIQTETHNFFAVDILVSNCIILDDPHKDRAEAESKTLRDSVWEYFQSTLYSRLEGAGAVIVILQRWHINDMVGRLHEEQEKLSAAGLPHDEWEIINFPAIAEVDEYISIPTRTGTNEETLVRKEGEALWPSKFGLDVLENIKAKDLMNWTSQYQQHPILAENQEFKQKMFKYYDIEDIKGKYLQYYTLVDPAISQKKSADNTVVLTIAKEIDGPNIYRIREDAGHFTPNQTIDLIFKHNSEYHGDLYIETIAYQEALKYFVEEEQIKRQTYFTVNEIKPKTKKEMRIRGLLPMYGVGIIHHLRSDTEYEVELLQFPRGKHDDRIDAMALGIGVLENTRLRNKIRQFKPNWMGYGIQKK